MTVGMEQLEDKEKKYVSRTKATKDQLVKRTIIDKGRAGGSLCPRRGTVILRTRENQIGAIETNCKSWDCLACRDRKMAMVKATMSYGVSALGQCYLVSLTFVAIDARLRKLTKSQAKSERKPWRADAKYAKKIFKKWLALLSSRLPPMKWFLIPELTKRGQVHFHLIVGGIGKRKAACTEQANYGRSWRNKECSCLEHVMSKAWREATRGHSWVVDVRPVLGKFGAAAYLAKYLTKDFKIREKLEEMGFIRRYSTSRNWPRGAQMKREGTVDGSWTAEGWERGHKYPWIVKKTRTMKEARQVGTDVAKLLQKDRKLVGGLNGNVGKYAKVRAKGRSG